MIRSRAQAAARQYCSFFGRVADVLQQAELGVAARPGAVRSANAGSRSAVLRIVDGAQPT